MAQKQLKKSNPTKIQKVIKNGQSDKKVEYTIFSVGRRKTATARVRLAGRSGMMTVNGIPAEEYFKSVDPTGIRLSTPFKSIGDKTYAFSAKVGGSGLSSQLDAVVHGLSRALLKLNLEFRPALRKVGLLTRDDRMRESRKIGTGGKARRQKQSPKR